MRAFHVLLKKDIRMMRWEISVTAFLLIASGTAGLTSGEVGVSFVFAMMVLTMFVSVFIFVSFSKEWKTGLLLQMPQSANMLITSKIVSLLIPFLFLLLLTVLVLLTVTMLLGTPVNFESVTTFIQSESVVLASVLSILLFVFYWGLWAVFVALFIQYATKNLKFGNEWLGLFVMFILMVGLQWLMESRLYKTVFHSDIFPTFTLSGGSDVFHMGDLVFYIATGIGLFVLSTWILDKKVEV